MSACRSCGAPIEWAITGKGKRMPLDADPDQQGTFVLERGCLQTAFGADPSLPRRTSHFATCPNAADHRRTSSTPTRETVA